MSDGSWGDGFGMCPCIATKAQPVEQKHHSFPWPLRVGAPMKLMQFVDRWVLELLVQPPILPVEEALLKSEPKKENL